MNVLHVSAECYPAAKAGGLGDVVGALPKYLNDIDFPSTVIMPKYRTPWVRQQEVTPIFTGTFPMLDDFIPFSVEEVTSTDLGFPLYLVNIIGQFDRPGIYGDPQAGWYTDNESRFLYFQRAVAEWLLQLQKKPAIIHCHDYHSGVLPFILTQSFRYQKLRSIPTVFTIHNGEYHGSFDWSLSYLIPPFPPKARGLLEWDYRINPLACGIKCAWHVTTVSPTYLEELSQDANGLEILIRQEKEKASGVLNGIDDNVWDPTTDPLIRSHFAGDVSAYKRGNKEALSSDFLFDPRLPVFTFIGRLVREKGADLLPDLIDQILSTGADLCFLVLGTGEPEIHQRFQALRQKHTGRFDVALKYDERLAHQLYAGSDFLLMPSRVEPCGLNQLYALRYGTVPIVRSVGGLKDTVIDLSESKKKGRGFRFDHFTLEDARQAVWRAREAYDEPDTFADLRKRIMQLDFSWTKAAHNYSNIYNKLIKQPVA